MTSVFPGGALALGRGQRLVQRAAHHFLHRPRPHPCPWWGRGCVPEGTVAGAQGVWQHPVSRLCHALAPWLSVA